MDFILSFFKKLFTPRPEFPTGAYLNPEDKRDIHIDLVQAPVQIPESYITNLSALPVENQLSWGTCVWQAIGKLVELYIYRRTGKVVALSSRSGYILSKQEDGIPYLQGTYPRIAAGVLIKAGIALDADVPDDSTLPYQDYLNFPFSEELKQKMGANKLPGYAFVPTRFYDVCQAIFQNGAVTGSLRVDNNWFVGVIKKVINPIGLHYTLWYGYEQKDQIIWARNSWGTGWVGKMLDKNIPLGDFCFKWEDYKDDAFDVLAFVDIPKPILEEVKKLNYVFTRPMKYGDRSNDVKELQKRLVKDGYLPKDHQPTDFYGVQTRGGVLKYQKDKKIPAEFLDGGNTCGNRTLSLLNGTKRTLIDAIITVESQGNLYAIGDKNLKDKAYGCMQIRQPACDDVNRTYGTSYKAEQMLGNKEASIDVFNKYTEIYAPSGMDEQKARVWNGGPGGVMYPSRTDGYWAKVSALLK